MNTLAVLLLFSIIIVVHELGHYLAAVRAGVQVLSFNIGFGPILLSKKKTGTLYALRLLPFGGAVQLAGLDEEQKTKVPQNKKYEKKSLKSRLTIVAAGSLMNILLAFLIFFVVYSLIGMPQNVSNQIAGVIKDTPAYAAGLKRGDKLIKINGQKIKAAKEAINMIHNTAPGKQIKLTIERQGKLLDKQMVTVFNQDLKTSVIGIVLKGSEHKRLSFFKAARLGFSETIFLIKTFVLGIVSMLFKTGIKNIVGLLGIMQLSAEMLPYGITAYLRFLAMLSLNIGLLNLLPLPALDGGRLVFLFFELATGKKTNENLEKYVHLIGFMILLALLIIVTLQDLQRIFNG